MDRDTQIMEEAAKQRAHELKLAEINARAKQEMERQITARRESRHQMFIWGVGITGVVGVIITGIILISNATGEDREKEIQIREQQNRVAETCIREHNIWLDGDCIPAQRVQ